MLRSFYSISLNGCGKDLKIKKIQFEIDERGKDLITMKYRKKKNASTNQVEKILEM